MKLTEEEFNKIRHFQWVPRDIIGNGKICETVLGETSTRLFWIDFLRYVFAPRYSKQLGVTRIDSFDLNTPVIMEVGRNLRLPTQMETAMHYADNAGVRAFEFGRPGGFVALFVAVLTLIVFWALSEWKRVKDDELFAVNTILECLNTPVL